MLFQTTTVDDDWDKYASGDWPISTHADLRPHAARYSTNGASVAWRLRVAGVGKDVNHELYFPVAGQFVRFWASGLWLLDFFASGGAKFPKMRDSLPRTPINHSAKFDAASIIFGGKIINRTNTQTNKNSNRYIHTLPIGMCGNKLVHAIVSCAFFRLHGSVCLAICCGSRGDVSRMRMRKFTCAICKSSPK